MNGQINTKNNLNIEKKLEKLMETPGIKDIFEWTFSYVDLKNGNYFNKTYFEEFGGISYEKYSNGQINSEELIKIVKDKLVYNKNKFLEIKKELEKSGQGSEKSKLQIEGIEYMIYSLESAYYSVEIELEKAGKFYLDDKKLEELEQKVEKYQKLLYGKNIEESDEEIKMSFELMCREFFDGKNNLTSEEQAEYINLYYKIADSIKNKGKNINIPKIEDFTYNKPSKHILTEEILDEASKIYIPKGIDKNGNVTGGYAMMWQLCIGANNLFHEVKEDEDRSSIYDGSKYLEIPKGEEYEKKNLKEVLTLMIHEINSHYVNQKISENAGFQVRGASNVEKEEGLAVIQEKLLAGYSFDDLKGAGLNYPYSLAIQNTNEEFRTRFINLRMKLNGNKKGDVGRKRELRVKRGFSLRSHRAQYKDLSYTRGKNKMLDLILSGKNNLLDFYKGKFSIEDISSGRIDGVVKKEDILYPNFFPDLIIFMLGKYLGKIENNDFIGYLKEKYKGIFPESYLSGAMPIALETISKFSQIMDQIPDSSVSNGKESFRDFIQRVLFNEMYNFNRING